MKNLIKVFGLSVLSILAFASCEKNEEVAVRDTFTHRVNINAGGITKTVIDESGLTPTFKWSADDASRFVIKENNVSGTDIELSTTDSYGTITLGATFATETAASYKYTASLAKHRTGGGAPKIPATQTSTATSYDPDADILIAKAQTYDETKDEFSMQFGRPVVINKMTLKGLDEGQSISSITISADKDVLGYCNAETAAWTPQSSEVTIMTSQTVPAGGQITVFFVTMPVADVTLTVNVVTDDFIYSKTFGKTISFVRDQVTKFGVSGLTKNTKSDYSGVYVLASADGSAMANVWDGGNSLPDAYAVLEGGVLYYDPDAVTNIDQAKITVSKVSDSSSPYFGMYTMLQNGKYLYAAASDKNQLKGEDVPDVNAYWDISETAGAWSIVATQSSNRNILKHNPGNYVFSCYEAGQNAVALFEDFAPTPVISAVDIAIASTAVTSNTNIGASFNSNTASVSSAAYDDAGCTVTSTWLSTSVSGTTVYYTAAANTGEERVGYIKITATNSASHNAYKVISITQAAAGNSNKVDVMNSTWTGVSGTGYVNVNDLAGSASDAVYKLNCAGDHSSIQFRSSNSNSGLVSTTSGGRVRKVTVTWEGNTAADRTLDIYGKTTAYTAPSDLYSASTQGTKLGSIVNGTSTMLVITGDYEYIGMRSNSGAMYLTEIRVEWEPGYAITIDPGISNGTVSASANQGFEGATISLTATPSTGYAFDEWTVYKTGDPSTEVTVTSNSFTMPAYPVTVSASFVAVPTINMLKTTINSVAAAGVAGASETGVYEFLNGATDASVTVTCDGTVVTAASKNNGAVTYTVAANVGAARSGWIKVKYGSEDAHTVTVNQLAGSVSKSYTFTIDASGLVINNPSESSAYAKYAGNQTFTATATDGSGDEIEVTVVVNDVMPATGTNAGKLQIRKGSYIYNSTNLGSVGDITVADGVSVNIVKGATANPSSGSSGAFFKISKSTNGAAYPTDIVVSFTK